MGDELQEQAGIVWEGSYTVLEKVQRGKRRLDSNDLTYLQFC